MVSYFTEDIAFNFKEKRLTSRWLKFVAESEIQRLGVTFPSFSAPTITSWT